MLGRVGTEMIEQELLFHFPEAEAWCSTHNKWHINECKVDVEENQGLGGSERRTSGNFLRE